MRSRTSRAFTLIELLVVISIIALLIALLLPALQAARGTGRTIACASNWRQLAMVEHLYADDNNSYFIPSFNGQSNNNVVAGFFQIDISSTNPEWPHVLWSYHRMKPYLNNMHQQTGVFVCPEGEPQIRAAQAAAFSGYDQWVTYGYNVAMKDHRWNYFREAVKRPSATYLIMDKDSKDGTSGWRDQVHGPTVNWSNLRETLHFAGRWSLTSTTWSRQTGTWSWLRIPPLRHFGETANMTFVDGHAETQTVDQMTTNGRANDSSWTWFDVVP